jgi:CRP/FNR family transcriptional regulator, cyclic AMP receptor protein
MRFRKAHHETAAVDDLRNVGLFEGLSERELAHVAELAEPVEAEPDALLMEQGAVGLECFVVVDGSAGVYSGSHHLATVGPGTVVGEMALIDHRPRNATVRAETTMKLLAFEVAAFKHLLEDLPSAKARITEVLHTRAQANAGP